MKKKTHSLSVLLVKPSCESPHDILKDVSSLETHPIESADLKGTFYVKKPVLHSPSWVALFKSQLGAALDGLKASGCAAVLIVEAAGRVFALPFGYGRTLLKQYCYEENFGLRVVLSSVNPERLRSVDARSLEAVSLNHRSQASRATDFAGFGLDIERDLLYAATGEPSDSALGRQIAGKDAVKLNIPCDVTDIPALASRLLIAFQSTQYKENFAWIDHLAEVRDTTRITALDEAITAKVRARDLSRTWLAIPDIIEWGDVDGFKYQQPKRGALHADIAWDTYLDFLGSDEKLHAGVFKNQVVHCINRSSGLAMCEWPVYRCIYCEIDLDSRTYLLNNGKWYCADSDFLSQTDAAINKIKKSTLEFLDFDDKDEGAYNARVHESDKAYYALMDKKNIRHGGGASKIEFCDLYTTDKKLIHVKRYGGASVLSHLFAQGMVSARLLLSDSDFRGKVNEYLPKSHQLTDTEEKPTAAEFEVIYAIASNSESSNLVLPLFSKINLRNAYSTLTAFGITVKLAVILVKTGAAQIKQPAS